ncbi:hypothetical protein ATANTOWER_024143, partial [Ataeniobius toweri]|nr:hypothetical protein [Ataeniobius toweri]
MALWSKTLPASFCLSRYAPPMCCPVRQDLSISVPCPPSNASICTNELTQLSPSSPKKHLRNQQNKLCYDNLDPESLYPWRPDRNYLLEFRPFTFLIILWHNKISFHSFYFL